MRQLTLIKTIDGIDFYSYRPTVFRLYYPCYSVSDTPPYFKRIIHKIRMIRELYKSHYHVIYMKKDNKFLGHLVVGRGGSRIAMSGTEDIVIGPIWIIPNERSNGYGSRGIYFILHEMDLVYRYAYEYIERDNIPSIRTVMKNGFTFVEDCDEYGIFRVIRPCKDGHLKVFRKLQ